MRVMLKSKIHRARGTDVSIDHQVAKHRPKLAHIDARNVSTAGSHQARPVPA